MTLVYSFPRDGRGFRFASGGLRGRNRRHGVRRLGAVPSLKPGAEPVEARHQHALRHVHLVQLVAQLPLDAGRDDQLAREPFLPRASLLEPIVEDNVGPIEEREQSELVDDAWVERRGLEENGKGGQAAFLLLNARNPGKVLFQHFYVESVGRAASQRFR